MIERPDRYDVAGAVLFVSFTILCLAPIVERATVVFAFFDIINRGMK